MPASFARKDGRGKERAGSDRKRYGGTEARRLVRIRSELSLEMALRQP